MELTCHDDQVTLDALIDLAIRLDQLIQCWSKVSGLACLSAPSVSPEPMQISYTWHHIAEREKG